MPKRLDQLLEQQKKLAAQIAAVKAREKAQKRKDETRLKILVGSMIILKHQKNGTLNVLEQELTQFLTRDNDKKVLYLFDDFNGNENAADLNPAVAQKN